MNQLLGKEWKVMETRQTHGNKDDGMELLRTEVDECDRQIIKLLRQRFELVRKIGAYKANHNLPILDERRERELISDRRQQASGLRSDLVENIFKLIMAESRQVQVEARKDSNQKQETGS